MTTVTTNQSMALPIAGNASWHAYRDLIVEE